DPHAAVKRAAKARAERRVTIRPAPETMTYLSGLLPVQDGVAVYAALDAAAKAAAASGDGRSRGQVMADTLVARVTGVAGAEHPVELQLIITDRSLVGGGDEPALVPGYGPIPAGTARRWILSLLDDDDQDQPDPQVRARRFEKGRVWLRRLYTSPDGRHLVSLDSTRRSFPRLLRRLVETATGPAPPRTAEPRSGTSTTPSPTATAARPATSTGAACAPRATTPKKHPAGPQQSPTPPSPSTTRPRTRRTRRPGDAKSL
ncbi:MAG: DUF222 domain-containing protein, partial [Dermatophilaceae bacterium]